MIKKILILITLVAALGAGLFYLGNQTRFLDGTQPGKLKPAKTSIRDTKVASSIPKPPDVVSSRAVIDEIRQELQSVMLLNEKINKTQSSKADQIVRIQQQAKIHQRILSNIEELNEEVSAVAPSREVLLAQEKLRIIREETIRNKKTLQTSSN